MSNKQNDQFNESKKEAEEEMTVCESCGNDVPLKEIKQFPEGRICEDCHASNEEIEPDYITANF